MKIALIRTQLPVVATSLMIAASAAALGLLATAAIVTQAEASQTVRAKVVGEALKIKGTNAGDELILRLKAGDTNVLEVDVDDDTTADFSFDRSQFAEIKIDAKNGSDLIRIDETNGSITEPTSIRGGTGDDTILGGSAVDTIDGGTGDDFIDGNRANDIAFMGTGTDTFRWDPGDASDVIEGGTGSDTLLFNGAAGGETVDLSANEGRLVFFRQPANITMDMNNVEVAVFNALGGQDTITVNDLTRTDATQVDLNLEGGPGTGVGDGLSDRVVVNGTAEDDSIAVTGANGSVSVTGLSAAVAVRAAELGDRLDINTAAGDDTVDSTGLGAGVIQLFVDPVGP